MDIIKLGLEIKKLVAEDGSGLAQFYSHGVKLAEPPVVACNRAGTGCWTPIDALEVHNQHVPTFDSKAGLDAWVDRIKADVEMVGSAYDGDIIPGTTDPSLN